MEGEEKLNDIYLNLRFRKSGGQASSEIGKTDEYGNYIFEVEASNENLDLQNQIVLQNALLESKDNFIKYGVISHDHQHHKKDKNGNQITDTKNIIGEPIDVRTDGRTTYVIGKLYKDNEVAKDYIKMLKNGSTRVRASIGGVFPEVVADEITGAEKVVHVLWNDLALTATPVNNTVGHATFVRSMDSAEFVKALFAGIGTDHADFDGGRALIPENTGAATINILETKTDLIDKNKIKDLMRNVTTGRVKTREEAEAFLLGQGFNSEQSRLIVREIIEQGGLLMKSSFSDQIKKLMKSLGGGSDDELNKSEDEEKENLPDGVDSGDDDDTIDLDNEEDEDEDDSASDEEDADNEDTEKSVKKCNKSMSAGEEVVDATVLLKSLSDELDNLRKAQNDIGEAVVSLGKMVAKVSGEKLPPKAVNFAKSFGGASETTSVPTERPTQADFEKVQDVLMKSVQSGEISLTKSSMISSEFQRAMKTGSRVSPETYNFLAKKINGGK
mgnify:CR=1 FL=1